MTTRRTQSSKRRNKHFDKYFLYTNSVQSAEHDAELLWKMCRRSWGKNRPKEPRLQEDFSGTAGLCYEWVKLGQAHRAIAIDLDADALAWGATHHSEGMSESQLSRVQILHDDVMRKRNLSPNVICALNFSYFFIRDRATLKKYFTTARNSLAENGLLIIDTFGGPDYLMPHEDKRRNGDEKFNYWWEIETFDAISHRIKCHIHFQRDGELRRNRVFSYDWRLWSIPEISDVLTECGFSHLEYWAEGIDKKGHGDGIFKPIKSESNCETWITYIVARR